MTTCIAKAAGYKAAGAATGSAWIEIQSDAPVNESETLQFRQKVVAAAE